MANMKTNFLDILYSLFSRPIKHFFSVLISLFQIDFENILTIPLVTRNTRLILAFTIPTSVGMTVANEKRKAPTLISITEYCDVFVKCIAHLFSATDFYTEESFYFFDSAISVFQVIMLLEINLFRVTYIWFTHAHTLFLKIF